MRTVYEAAGGDVGLLHLARAWHARVIADEVVSHAFSHGFHPEHCERLAAYWGEALGGPTAYSATYGDETSVVRTHSGNGPHEEMDRQAIACFDQALADSQLAGDDRLRQVLHDYFAWATTTTMSRYHRSAAEVPNGLQIPHWSWDGLVKGSGPDDRRRLEAAREEFDADVIYLNTATLGLPPRRSWDALQAALAEWRAGGAKAPDYDVPVTRARRTYGALVGVDPQLVAVGSQVSVFAGLIAASLPDGAQVLTAAGDFTSILFPFHVQAARGITVQEVPLERLPEAVTKDTSLVSVAAVQSADGRVADLDALRRACAATGTEVLLDTTQAIGWLPVDAGQFAYTVCGGYKWLLAPRGTAYLTVRRDLLDSVVPHTAGWYAGADPWNSIYGTPLRLATDARRFDVSPAWHSWVGAAPALDLLSEIGTAALHAHALGLANRFRAGVGLPAGDSAIVSSIGDQEVPDLMKAATIAGVARMGRLRLSFHVSTSEQDVDRAIDVLSGHLRP